MTPYFEALEQEAATRNACYQHVATHLQNGIHIDLEEFKTRFPNVSGVLESAEAASHAEPATLPSVEPVVEAGAEPPSTEPAEPKVLEAPPSVEPVVEAGAEPPSTEPAEPKVLEAPPSVEPAADAPKSAPHPDASAPPAAAKAEVAAAETAAKAERGFIDRLIKNEAGKVHAGKAAGLLAAAGALSWAGYELLRRDDKSAEREHTPPR